MLKIHSFFKRFYKLIKSISKKTYRTCAIISTCMIIIAVIVLTSKDFGGSGKNRMVTADSVSETMKSEYEDEESKVLASNEETTEAYVEKVIIANNPISTSTSNGSISTSVGIEVSEQDYDALCRIVQAEAGGEDDMGKILVANVILNRVKSEIYPDTITEVIYDNQNGVQFQPTMYNSFNSIIVSDSTRVCVDRALAGEDYSQGAMYFAVKTSSSSWFNTSLKFLFEYSGHYFYM